MDLARTGTAIGATSPGQIRRAAAAGAGIIAITTIVLAVASGATWFGSTDQAVAPFTDTSYSLVEALRGAHGFGSPANDGSYDKVEALRGANGFAPAGPDRSYDNVEALRAYPPGS